jgi:phage repressor protein C with HTH and peptisase S24 domain
MLVSAKEKLIELYQDYELLELPMIDASAVAGYSDNIGQNLNKDVTNKKYPIIKMSNINYTNASILLIQGLSMYPTLKDGELVIVTPIPINRASGICAVSIRGSDAASGMFTVKRVIKNRDNVLTLSADRDKEEIDVQYSDILAIWQIGDTVFAPRRD